MDTEHGTRRDFVKSASGAAALAAASAKRVAGANDVVNFGIIGLGDISHGHVTRLKAMPAKVRITAVCDIYKPRLEWGVSATGAKSYHDYHDLLADSNVDAVIICTPDHWHAPMAIDAMRAGKDVDVEKPMSLTIDEAREMVRVSEETGRVLAVDSEGTARGIFKPAQAAVRAGLLGKLLWSQTCSVRNQVEAPWNYPIDENPSPKNIDWERFLGTAPKQPFNLERFFRWRRYRDYSGGIATDLYYHSLAPLIKVTGPEFPVRATAAGGSYDTPTDVMEVPDVFLMTLDFPSKHSMMVSGSLVNSLGLPTIIRGREANILFERDHFVLDPEHPFIDGFREKVAKTGLEGKWIEEKGELQTEIFQWVNPPRQEEIIAKLLLEPEAKSDWEDAARKDPDLRKDRRKRIDYFARVLRDRAQERGIKPLFQVAQPPAESFIENFIRCVHTREKPVLDGRLGFMTQVAVSLPVESYRRNRVMFFDPDKEIVLEQPA